MRKVSALWILIACVMLLSSESKAKSLIMGGVSHHTSDGYRDGARLMPWNENNPLIAVEHKGFFVGEMVNSYHEDTTFAGYHHTAGGVFGLMGMVSNKYKLSPLPRVGSLAVGGFFTAKLGPVLLLTVPGEVYVLTIQLKL